MEIYTFCISNPNDGFHTRAANKRWDVVTILPFDTIKQAVTFAEMLSIYWMDIKVLKDLGKICFERHR